MILLKAQIYRCQNQLCCAEVQVTKDTIEGDENPRCCCGAEMKKPWNRPVLRELNPDQIQGPVAPSLPHLFCQDDLAAFPAW
jgi:hypothetical protein